LSAASLFAAAGLADGFDAAGACARAPAYAVTTSAAMAASQRPAPILALFTTPPSGYLVIWLVGHFIWLLLNGTIQ
jgi:hypothetical protein